MGQPPAGRHSALVVRGPGAKRDVVDNTLRVLKHFGIPTTEVDWRDLQELIADGTAVACGVIVFETGAAYTDEHIGLPEDITAPVLRVVTDESPPSAKILTGTWLVGTVGFGVDGAVNAGLNAARILAVSDPELRDLLKTKPYQIT